MSKVGETVSACLREGTRVWYCSATLAVDGPTPALPVDGEGEVVPPSTGGPQGGSRTTREPRGLPVLTPIQSLQIGDLVLGHDARPHRILHTLRKRYRGAMIGVRHGRSPETLWLTADHPVLAKPRPRSLGGQRDWSAIPPGHFQRGRQLRREASPMERLLWSALRGDQLSFKFRRQHPVGPYIADFYCRHAHLVVEVDGSTHFTPEGAAYDAARDAYMQTLGLDVLRFSTAQVGENLEGVCTIIQDRCRIRTESLEGSRWIRAGALQPGDTVSFSRQQLAVPIESLQTAHTEEDVYDLQVEEAASFLTEVCAVRGWDGMAGGQRPSRACRQPEATWQPTGS